MANGYAESVKRLRRINSGELVGRINRIRRMDASKLTDMAIRNRLGRVMDGFAHKTMLLATNATFRARVNVGSESFRHVRELWYPPEGVARRGRFNGDGQSVFYSASSMAAAMWEVGAKVGQRVTILACGSRGLMAEVICAQIGVHLYEGKPQPSELPLSNMRADSLFQRDLEEDKIDRKWRLVDDLLSELATAHETDIPDLYRITSSFGATFRRIPTSEGITYPSVATNLKAFNSVLSREAADKHFFPAEAWEFEILNWSSAAHIPVDLRSKLEPIRPIRRTKNIRIDGTIEWAQESPEVMNDYSSLMPRIAEARASLQFR
ncbi:MAG: RES domain-containing protein [Alphaproteobacteria bacterium]|nr:RES domain-containing protein [Alphaproteobacteria bacterium]MBU0863907.1 RES domain-containing protein [Alphaproteobacteria bacterium]MBU1824058.1 RES domain-containing protein [Alphaproteobacteria bacterium]